MLSPLTGVIHFLGGSSHVKPTYEVTSGMENAKGAAVSELVDPNYVDFLTWGIDNTLQYHN